MLQNIFLNKCWSLELSLKEDYFSNTIKLSDIFIVVFT